MIPTENYPLFETIQLHKFFPIKGNNLIKKRYIQAVTDVSLTINEGESLGLVGESGCGKSTFGRLLLRLYNPTKGKILYQNKNITNLTNTQLIPLRKDLQMIFQDPYASLNPRMTVREILAKPLKVQGVDYSEKDINETLERVGLSPNIKNRYPHEFSGGQRQRIGISRAIILKPRFIVCDEPVSALDVSVQAQILNLLMELKKDLGFTYLFISHALSVVKHISDRVAVMYLGGIVEIQSKQNFFSKPLHPYSEALMSAIPTADPYIQRNRKKLVLKGDIPSPLNPPKGCPFHPRCSKAQAICYKEKPHLTQISNEKHVSCHYPLDTDFV
ncbi:MAG: ABC transporter ATP-binding protein [Anaerolineaceae bacterium]|jgi:oligopeptide/dipeptide ABC transporter ATP-binding protein